MQLVSCIPLTMSNSSITDLPPLPSYTLTLRQPLVPGIPDNVLSLILLVIAYWALSMFFHFIDVYDYFPQYRLHTPAELLKRNHVSRWEVVRDVIVQQIIQTAFGFVITYFDKPEYIGKEEYDVAVWATRIRIAQRVIPRSIMLLGIDPAGLAGKLSAFPVLAGVVSGGHYPFLFQKAVSSSEMVPSFAPWELAVAGAIYWYLIPAVQFTFAIFFVDTWQYFLHRAMHMNRWLYTTFHARHHRLYVPYAFGALYNHPVEGFLLDTAGTGLAFLVTSMTTRQGMWFFTGSVFKTVDDHCGYAFPFDPLQRISSNNAAYHDIHHQSWGIKTNFSQPFFTFWDGFLNTRWEGGDVKQRYERSRVAAQKQLDEDNAKDNAAPAEIPVVTAKGGKTLFQRGVRKTTGTLSPQSEGLKGVGHRLNGSIRQK